MRRAVVLVIASLGGCTKDSPPATTSVKVQLPSARRADEVVSAAQVTLGKDGNGTVNGVAFASDAELVAKLRELRTKTPSLELHLLADPSVTYARVVAAIDAAHQAGVVDVSFDSPEAPKPEPATK